MDAGILDVYVAAETRVKQEIPAGVMVVIVDEHAIVIPFPIAAAVQIIGSHYPVRIVVEHDAPRADLNPASDNLTSHVLVTAVRIGAAGANSVVIVVPIAIVGSVAMFVPAFVLTVVVTLAVIIAVFFPAFVLPIVVVLVAILARGRQRERASQRHHRHA